MRSFFLFLLKHNYFFIFLFLEITCVFLMVKSNGFQGSRVLNSSNKTIANVYQANASAKE